MLKKPMDLAKSAVRSVQRERACLCTVYPVCTCVCVCVRENESVCVPVGLLAKHAFYQAGRPAARSGQRERARMYACEFN